MEQLAQRHWQWTARTAVLSRCPSIAELPTEPDAISHEHGACAYLPMERPQSRPEPSGSVASVAPQSHALLGPPAAPRAPPAPRGRAEHAQPDSAYSSSRRQAPALD